MHKPDSPLAAGDPDLLRRFRGPVEASDAETLEHWRRTGPAERGRALWGLLEFADRVQRGKEKLPEPEPMPSLPVPVGKRPRR